MNFDLLLASVVTLEGLLVQTSLCNQSAWSVSKLCMYIGLALSITHHMDRLLVNITLLLIASPTCIPRNVCGNTASDMPCQGCGKINCYTPMFKKIIYIENARLVNEFNTI